MADRKVFADSVTPLPEQGPTTRGLMVRAAKPEHRDETMTLLFSVEVPHAVQEELEERVAKGEVVPVEELNKRYAANAEDIKKLKTWLKEQGFKIMQTAPDNTGVYAQASIDKIEKSLKVNMVRVTKNGVTYTAAQDAPSLPSEVGENVRAILGLQPFRHAQKHFRICTPKDGNRLSLAGSEETKVRTTTRAAATAGRKAAAKSKGKAVKPTKNTRNMPPYLVSEILKAYNADGLTATGRGQTIAILIDTVPSDSDLKAFWRANNLPTTAAQIEKINVKGGPLPPIEGEETLDVAWASGIAPKAKIRIYASGSLAFVDLDLALDRILADLPTQPGMRQLSISLGLGETFMPRGEVAAQHQRFLRLAAAGVNVFVSSGDAGSNPDVNGQNSNGPLQAEYESSDPSVIAVGGTTLKLTSNGQIADESGWTGSGGGKSIFFKRPSWQHGNGMPPDNVRLVPDVSLAADPSTGAFLVLNGRATQIGGTSWSAPVWAGFCALMNEARKSAGKPFLPFLPPLLYPLMGSDCFRDIQSGDNGAFNGGPGYDMVTGIGAPRVKQLIQLLP